MAAFERLRHLIPPGLLIITIGLLSSPAHAGLPGLDDPDLPRVQAHLQAMADRLDHVMGCLELQGALTPEQQETHRRLAAAAYNRRRAIALGRADGDAAASSRHDLAAIEETLAAVPGLLGVPELLRLNACLDAGDAQAQQQAQADAYNADKAAAVARARSTRLSPAAQGRPSLAITPDPMVLAAPFNLPGATR